jgi:hypothetical protein
MKTIVGNAETEFIGAGSIASLPTTATAVDALAIVAKALPSSRAESGVTTSKRHCG